MNKVATTGAIVILVTAILFVLLVAYWLLWPYKVMVNHKAEVQNSPVMVGHAAMVLVEFEKFMNVPATITRELVDGTALPLPGAKTSNIPVGPGKWFVPIFIPESVLPGAGYQIHTTYRYQVNPIRTVTVEWITPEFTIVPNTELTTLQKSTLKNALKELMTEEGNDR